MTKPQRLQANVLGGTSPHGLLVALRIVELCGDYSGLSSARDVSGSAQDKIANSDIDVDVNLEQHPIRMATGISGSIVTRWLASRLAVYDLNIVIIHRVRQPRPIAPHSGLDLPAQQAQKSSPPNGWARLPTLKPETIACSGARIGCGSGLTSAAIVASGSNYLAKQISLELEV